MTYRFYSIKRHIEDIIIFPFILLGRMIGRYRPLKQEYSTFFFFPFYHVGGAEKIHAQITRAAGNERCIIFFTRRSENNLFYEQFRASGCVIKDISRYTDNKWLYFLNLIYRGIIAFYINRQTQQPVIFNGQCNFGYKLSPWIKTPVPQIELIHSFNSFSWIRLPFLPFISRTVMISHAQIKDHLEQYRKLNVPDKYNGRIQYIINGIHLPEEPVTRQFSGETLNVLYVGRATSEKRVHLIGQMAQQMDAIDKKITFSFLGGVQGSIPPELHPYCRFYPSLSDEKLIAAHYKQADVLIIVSDTEGFPMVIMEAMAYGCAILSTPVGDIPFHIKDGQNGFLFSSVEDERKIIEEGLKYAQQLKEDPALLTALSARNRQYAQSNFDIRKFNQAYTELLNNPL